jgi:hypothetical protein
MSDQVKLCVGGTVEDAKMRMRRLEMRPTDIVGVYVDVEDPATGTKGKAFYDVCMERVEGDWMFWVATHGQHIHGPSKEHDPPQACPYDEKDATHFTPCMGEIIHDGDEGDDDMFCVTEDKLAWQLRIWYAESLKAKYADAGDDGGDDGGDDDFEEDYLTSSSESDMDY